MALAKRLVIVTHVTHYQHQGEIYAYGPYAREINIWCDLFPEVVIAAPSKPGPPPGDGLKISRDNVSLNPITASGGNTLAAKLMQVLLLPWIVWQLCAVMLSADAIHVRCPGNLGLFGIILAPLFSRKLVAKYAGQWDGYPNESWSFRLQRRLLKSRWWRGIVTVYGNWPNQPKHVIPFFTSVMTSQQVERADRIASRKKPQDLLSLLFVGRLSKNKNADVLIDAVARLKQQGLAVRCDIVGDGSHRRLLEEQAARLQLNENVHFAGAVDFDRVIDYYDRANVLVLVSDTEGWPKAIAEAMACGLTCIGSDHGLVPRMLAESRGYVVPARNVDALVESLHELVSSPARQLEVSRRAAEFGQRFSVETLREALRDLLTEHWGVDMGDGEPRKLRHVVSDFQNAYSKAATQ